MIELSGLLGSARDPGLVLVCVGIVLYLNRDYVKKTEHDELKGRLDEMQKEYVSKEKLADVLKPFSDQLSGIGREIGEIKKFIMEVLKK